MPNDTIIAVWGRQGALIIIKAMVKILSRRLVSIRVDRMAGTLQPRPSMTGMDE